ncbi:MAG: hypothetical protein AAFW73_22530 [Bacteroidota bacterium]
MKSIYFKCTALSDLLFNAALSTEGNLTSLDYIPGSNFLGLVAGKCYADADPLEALDLFHNGQVLFGDAHLAMAGRRSYPLPLSLAMEKGKQNLGKDTAWVHHLKQGAPTQLRQQRGGYFDVVGNYCKRVGKRFALKSAYDREKRRSKDSQMFGYDALRRGQSFVFTVSLREGAEGYESLIRRALVGEQRIGKSKSAEYGRVLIEAIEQVPADFVFADSPVERGDAAAAASRTLVIYAESKLCFLDAQGIPTFEPDLSTFGPQLKGRINWAKSQLRTYCYTSWDGHRRAPNARRDCLDKGSVLVIDLEEGTSVGTLYPVVGAFQSEGLGRVRYNPVFLEADQAGWWTFKLRTPVPTAAEALQRKGTALRTASPKTSLGQLLNRKRVARERQRKIASAVAEFMKNRAEHLACISPSQWGQIRRQATLASSVEDLRDALFLELPEGKTGKNGLLMRGVAAQKYWLVQDRKPIKILQGTLKKYKSLGTAYCTKLAATMAQSYDQKKCQDD